MPLSEAMNNAVLDQFVGKTNAAFPPANVFVGFSSTTPTTTGGNVTEPSGGAYARVELDPTDFIDAAVSANENDEDVVFPQATAHWLSGANLTHAVLYSAASGGTFLGFKALGTPIPIFSGDTAKILAGDLTMLLGGAA